MREGIAVIAFTKRGAALAERLSADLGGSVSRSGEACSLADWTAEQFPRREALLFIGAAGIAVRAIAPHVRSKAEDPAVLCLDEYGRHVIPLLSGHLGGANDLARRVAALTGGEAVITTATDLNGVFAVDLWAKRQGLQVLNPERIRDISAKLLRGEEIRIACPYPIRGLPPEHVSLSEIGDAVVSWRAQPQEGLKLVPRILSLGIGCRRGTSAETLEEAFSRFCAERGILPAAVRSAASIDLKQDEAGLLAFCLGHGWKIAFYSADELCRAEGPFSASAFVQTQVGVDNVCERAAVLRSGGALVEKKYKDSGVTFALAEASVELDWRC